MIFAFALTFALTFVLKGPFAQAAANASCEEIMTSSSDLKNKVDDEVTESLSQLIRSNSVHYWSYVKKGCLGAYSQYEGIIAGDPHMGNFSVVPVTLRNGRRDLRFVDIDFDDAGRGPFALDFARFVITVKAVDKDVKMKDLVQAYVDGLSGTKADVPARVQEALSMTMADYDALDANYVDKKTSHGKFKIKAGELEPYRAKYSLSDIASLFPGEKVLDVATRPEDRGGSAGSVRIWVLTESADRKQHISEIKGYAPTALLRFGPQDPPTTWVQKVQATFWPDLDPSGYDLKVLAGDLVWVRGKKIPLLDVPYKLKSASDQVFVRGLALYDANLLGQVHGRQSKAYVSLINKDPDAFREAVKQLSHDYIDYAEKTLR